MEAERDESEGAAAALRGQLRSLERTWQVSRLCCMEKDGPALHDCARTRCALGHEAPTVHAGLTEDLLTRRPVSLSEVER